MKHSVTILLLICSLQLISQNESTNLKDISKYTSHNKGKLYVYWGGNRAHYSDSDIHFKGTNYDFILKDVASHDKPKGYHIDYINPTRMTIPQTNFRLGYFISDHYNISVGVDHMKYVMTRNVAVRMTGNINIEGSNYNGTYNNDYQVLSADFLKFEHTDGLNYINSEFSRVDDVGKYLFNWNSDKFQINITEGIGAGVLFPKTNTTWLGQERYDEFHISGYGLSVKGGLNFTFFKHFFIQNEIKGGYINMQDIRTTKSKSDRASQEFYFLQTNLVLGAIFTI